VRSCDRTDAGGGAGGEELTSVQRQAGHGHEVILSQEMAVTALRRT
jgi:hypothetical protein